VNTSSLLRTRVGMPRDSASRFSFVADGDHASPGSEDDQRVEQGPSIARATTR